MRQDKEAIQKWQDRIEATFKGPHGLVGERVQGFFSAERAHGVAITQNLNGFMFLMDSFMDFAVMTIEEASSHGHTLNVFDFAFNTVAVQRVRSALRLFYDGYYYDAASLIRGVFEICMYLGAVLRGHFSFDHLFSPNTPIEYGATPQNVILKIHRRHQQAVAKLVRQEMRGERSGLSQSDQDEIEAMFNSQHHHVHYGSSTIIEFAHQMLADKTLPPVVPVLDERRASIFCNPCVCVSWCLLLVLPWLSLPSKYSEQWQQRYLVLDESFEFFIRSWEKPIGRALANMIRQRFAFDRAVAEGQVLKTTPYDPVPEH